MKALLKTMTIALATTVISQSALAAVPARLNCKVDMDNGEAYLMVRAGGEYRAPRVAEMIEMMERDPSLHETLKEAVLSSKMRSFLTTGDGVWKSFWFKNRPSTRAPLATCKDKTVSGAVCFDRMIKRDPRFQVPEGNNAPFWMFAEPGDVETIYTIAGKMGCSNDYRLGAPQTVAQDSRPSTAQQATAPAAPTASAPAPRPAAAAPAVPVTRPAQASAPAPAPRPASEVLSSEMGAAPLAAVTASRPGGVQDVVMTISAPASR